MRKKRISVLAAAAAVYISCCVFAGGCGDANRPNEEWHNSSNTNYTEEEIKIHEQAENAAADHMKELTDKKPYNVMLLKYTPEEFYLSGESKDEAGNKLYEVTGRYACSFSCDMKKSFLDVELEQKFLMRQTDDGTWETADENIGLSKTNVLKNSAENAKDTVRTLEESAYRAFLSKDDAKDKNVRQIEQSLLYDFMLNMMDQTEEQRTFMPVAMENKVENLHQLHDWSEIKGDLRDTERIWESDGGIYGRYIGYIEGLGYDGPFFADDWKNAEKRKMNQSGVLVIEKKDGYYLQWQ